MSDSKAIYLSDFTVAIRSAGGVTLLSRSDALEGGAYIPPGEIWLNNAMLDKLIEGLQMGMRLQGSDLTATSVISEQTEIK